MIIDLSSLFSGTAKLDQLAQYKAEVKRLAGEGQEVILTGPAPIWLYLVLAHALHGVARKLSYRSPVTGDVVVFDHSPD